MPMVKGKKFPYTEKGMMEAKMAKEEMMMPAKKTAKKVVKKAVAKKAVKKAVKKVAKKAVVRKK